MRKVMTGVLAAATFALGLGVSAETAAQAPAAGGAVNKLAADNCANAHAVLMGTNTSGGDDGFFWTLILGVIRVHPHWRLLERYEPMISQSMSLEAFDVTPAGDQHTKRAYVAHCGHGATCNELARAVKRLYPMTAPEVYCGLVPVMLVNGAQGPSAF